MNDSDRRSILRNLTDEHYDDIMRVCSYYPHIEMEVKVKVIDDEDEKTVTQGALVTLVVNLKRQNLKVMFNNDETQKHKSMDNNIEDAENAETSDLVDAEGATNNVETVEATVAVNKPANKPWKDSSSKKKAAKKPKAKPAKPKPSQAKPSNNNNPVKNESAPTETNENEANTNENDEDDDDKMPPLVDASSDEENDNSPSKKTNKKSNSVENLGNKDESSAPKKDDGDAYFEKFQQMQKKKEKLETKAKISHRVYCPFFPEVKIC